MKKLSQINLMPFAIFFGILGMYIISMSISINRVVIWNDIILINVFSKGLGHMIITVAFMGAMIALIMGLIGFIVSIVWIIIEIKRRVVE